MMTYHITKNFRSWLADLTYAELSEFATKLDMPMLLDLARERDAPSPIYGGEMKVKVAGTHGIQNLSPSNYSNMERGLQTEM